MKRPLPPVLMVYGLLEVVERIVREFAPQQIALLTKVEETKEVADNICSLELPVTKRLARVVTVLADKTETTPNSLLTILRDKGLVSDDECNELDQFLADYDDTDERPAKKAFTSTADPKFFSETYQALIEDILFDPKHARNKRTLQDDDNED